jgi:hypothetical protein
MIMSRELQASDPQFTGPYRLGGLLGVGGMGRVFLGVSPGGRPVAVKVIRADLAREGTERQVQCLKDWRLRWISGGACVWG